MAAKCALAVCFLMLPLITGMRDPFQPVPDSCQLAQMVLWRYHGMVAVNDQVVGILRDPTGRWQRLREENVLPGGWRIVRLNKEEATLENGERCSPANWRWKREGTQDEKKHNGPNLALLRNAERERKGKSGPVSDADGR